MALTVDEAFIIQKFQFPIMITSNDADQFEPGEYRIHSIEKFYDKHLKEYHYSISVTKRGRCIYHLPISAFDIAPKLEYSLQKQIKELEYRKLKASIEKLVNDGGNKTTITKMIKEIIDEIKKKK